MTSERAREVRSWDIENPMLETKRYDQIGAFSYRTRYFLTKTHENPKSQKFFFKFSFWPIFLTVYFTHIFKGLLWGWIFGEDKFFLRISTDVNFGDMYMINNVFYPSLYFLNGFYWSEWPENRYFEKSPPTPIPSKPF